MKFTIFALFYFVLRANSTYKPPGGLYSEGQFNGGFFALRFWRAYKVFFFFFLNPALSYTLLIIIIIIIIYTYIVPFSL